MATECIAQVTFKFEPKSKPIVATFDTVALTKRLAACLADGRQPGKVQHQTVELFRQRAFGLACGYADCNDAARLADDPLHKLLVEPIRSPAPPWPRSPRSRGSRTPWAGAR